MLIYLAAEMLLSDSDSFEHTGDFQKEAYKLAIQRSGAFGKGSHPLNGSPFGETEQFGPHILTQWLTCHPVNVEMQR